MSKGIVRSHTYTDGGTLAGCKPDGVCATACGPDTSSKQQGAATCLHVWYRRLHTDTKQHEHGAPLHTQVLSIYHLGPLQKRPCHALRAPAIVSYAGGALNSNGLVMSHSFSSSTRRSSPVCRFLAAAPVRNSSTRKSYSYGQSTMCLHSMRAKLGPTDRKAAEV